VVTAGILGGRGMEHGGGYAASVMLYHPKGVAIDPDRRHVYFSDSANHVVRLVGASANIEPVVAVPVVGTQGRSGAQGDFGPALRAQLFAPHGVAVDPIARELYIADSANHAVRLVDLVLKTIVTIAGRLGSPGSSGDGGTAGSARLRYPAGLAVEPQLRRLYVADSGNHAVRVIDLTSGVIATLVGALGVRGTAGGLGGPALDARLRFPDAVAVTPGGEALFVADTGNHAVRRVDLKIGRVASLACNCAAPLEQVVAGQLGKAALPAMASKGGRPFHRGVASTTASDDAGPATAALLRQPSGLALDAALEYLYLADSSKPIIRRVALASGNISVQLRRPGHYARRSQDGGHVGLAVDPVANRLFMAEAVNHVLRSVELVPSGLCL